MKIEMEKMTGRIAAALLVGGLLVSAAVAQTDTPPPPPQGQMQGPPPGGRGGQGGQTPDPARRAEMLHKALALSDDQTAQVKAVLVDGAAKADAIRSNTNLPPKQRRNQAMKLRSDEESKLEAILTPDQKTKFEAIMARQRERMEERREGGSTPNPAPPPPPASTPPPPQ